MRYIKRQLLLITLVLLPFHSNASSLGGSLNPGALFSIEKGGRCGYINVQGRVVIKEIYERCWGFSEGLSAVQLGGKLGFIDETGQMIIPPQFDWYPAYFREGFAPISSRDVSGHRVPGYVDKRGQIQWFPAASAIYNFSEGLALIEQGGKSGYIDKTMQFVIGSNFTTASSFYGGLARVCLEYGSCYYIDHTGQKRIDRVGTSFSEGVAFFEAGRKYGLMDSNGQILLTPQFENANSFSEGLAGVQIGEKWGYIDKSGKMVIAPRFDSASEFSPDGIAVVTRDDKYLFIDRTGKELFDAVFDYAVWVDNGLGKVTTGRTTAYINRMGQLIWRSTSR